MKLEKPSLLLAVVSWLCVLVLSWQMIMRLIPLDFLTWFFFALFLIVALIASGVYADDGGRKKKRGLIEIRAGNFMYSEENGDMTVAENGGKIFVIIKVPPGYAIATNETTPTSPAPNTFTAADNSKRTKSESLPKSKHQ
jgi:hypothetical protein